MKISRHASFHSRTASLILAWALAIGFRAVCGEPDLAVLGVEDRAVYGEPVLFSVPRADGHIYEVLLDGQPVPTEVANLVSKADYHEIAVARTNLATGTVTNRLVRFIVRVSGRGDTENGLPTWTPYPVVNSSAAEMAEARFEIIAPDVYPADLGLPFVVWVRDGRDQTLRVNATLDIEGQTQAQLRRGVGSAFLSPAPPGGQLNIPVRIPGLETNIAIEIEPETRWTDCSGMLAGDVVWDAGTRISVTNNLTVQEGSKLIINEGVVVRLSRGVNITNHGQILIVGTSRRPVVFAPAKWSEPWGGFFL